MLEAQKIWFSKKIGNNQEGVVMNLEKIEDSHFSYSDVPTFFKFPHSKELNSINVAMVGVPLDQATTNRAGTRFGPRSIRLASQMYGAEFRYEEGIFDIELERFILKKMRAVDYGDMPIIPTMTELNIQSIEKITKKIIDAGVLPVIFGGDHSISYPIVKAFSNEKFDIIQFDTHLDFANDTGGLGMIYSHGNPIKRISELGNVGQITQIGIRGLLNDKNTYLEARNFGSKIITAQQVYGKGLDWVIEQIPQSKNIYVTIDIDVFDPSVAPGTGTPEPGGLSYLQVKKLLTALPTKGRVLGFDLVEVNPLYDSGEMTSQLAARITLDFLGAIMSGNEMS